MIIAVTGASGHVGANLCRLLLNKGHKVKALVHNHVRGIEGLDLTRVPGNVNDPVAIKELVKDAEVVYHLAAKISILNKEHELLRRINVDGTMNVLQNAKAAGVRRFVHFSSIHALDHNPQDERMDENRPLITENPLPYELTKAEAEEMVTEMSGNGIETIILNPTAIIGPLDFFPSLMGQVLIKLYKRTLPGLIPGGYDWVDVRDISEAAYNASERGKSGNRYILSGKWADLKTLAKIVGLTSGKRPVTREFNFTLAKLGVPFMKLYSRLKNEDILYSFETLEIVKQGNRHIDHSRAVRELGFSPRPLEESIRDSIEWFKTNRYI